MDEVRYQQESRTQRQILFALAFSGTGRAPVYSGDVALALQVSHRLVKDRIEAFYPALCLTDDQPIYLVRCKRTRSTRQLHGYLLPLPAILRVLLPYKPWASFAFWEWNAILHTCYSDGPYKDTLN